MAQFIPQAPGVLIAATTSSSYQPVSASADSVLVSNESAAWAWIMFGTATQAANATFPTAGTNQNGFPVPPGGQIIVAMPQNVQYFAAVLRTGTGNVTFVPGRAQ